MRSTRRWTWHLEIHSGLLCASRDMIWIHIMYTYHKRIGFASCKDDNKDKKLNLTGSLFETYLKSHITLNSFYWYLWHEKHMVYQNLFKDYVACQRPLKCFKTMFLSYYWKLCQTCMETKEENPKPHLLMSEKTFEEAKKSPDHVGWDPLPRRWRANKGWDEISETSLLSVRDRIEILSLFFLAKIVKNIIF